MGEIRTEIDVLQNLKEAETAFFLSLKAFYPEGAPSGTEELWRYKWFEDPSFDLKNIFVIKDQTGRMLGGLRVVSRRLRRIDQVFKMFGIAETFVDPSNQGFGYASLLTKYAIQEGQRRGYDILAVVARTQIDYFYLKYGAYGLGAYNEVMLRGWRDTIKKATEFSVSDIHHYDLDIANKAYEYSYFNSFGPMKRTFDHWKFLVEKISRQGEEIRILKKAAEIVGYFVAKENQIIEIALLPGIPYRPVVDFLWYDFVDNQNVEGLKLKIPYTHRLFDDDLQLDVTVKNRECYYGGHIVKVLNKNRVLTLMEKRPGGSLTEKLIKPVDFGRGNVKVMWDGKEARASYSSGSDPSYHETLFLLGATSIYGRNKEPCEIAGAVPFVLCKIDEF